MTKTPQRLTFMKFGDGSADENCADIIDNTAANGAGEVIGFIERVHGERFASVSSRTRVRFISHYDVYLTSDKASEPHDDLKTLVAAKAWARKALQS